MSNPSAGSAATSSKPPRAIETQVSYDSPSLLILVSKPPSSSVDATQGGFGLRALGDAVARVIAGPEGQSEIFDRPSESLKSVLLYPDEIPSGDDGEEEDHPFRELAEQVHARVDTYQPETLFGSILQSVSPSTIRNTVKDVLKKIHSETDKYDDVTGSIFVIDESEMLDDLKKVVRCDLLETGHKGSLAPQGMWYYQFAALSQDSKWVKQDE